MIPKVGDAIVACFRAGNEMDIEGTVVDVRHGYIEIRCEYEAYDQLGNAWRSPHSRLIKKGELLLAVEREVFSINGQRVMKENPSEIRKEPRITIMRPHMDYLYSVEIKEIILK